MPGGAKLHCEIGQLRDNLLVAFGHGGVDLERQSAFAAAPHAVNGGLPGARHLTPFVVDRGVDVIEADADASHAGRFESGDDLGGKQCAVGTKDDAQAATGAVPRQLEDILAQQRLAAAEHHDLEAGAGDLVEEGLALGGGKLIGVRLRAGRPVAVLAVLVALSGRVPGDDHQACSFSQAAASRAW